MLDLFNVNIGGYGDNPRNSSSADKNGISKGPGPRGTRPRQHPMAKKIANVFDVADFDGWEVADALWEHTNDGVKASIQKFVDAWTRRALIQYDGGQLFTDTEIEIGNFHAMVRAALTGEGQ